MKHLFSAMRLLLIDMASTVFFLVLFWLSHSIELAVALSITLGLAQFGWEITRRRPIDTMQWVSLILVVASGSATLMTNNPRFITLKLIPLV